MLAAVDAAATASAAAPPPGGAELGAAGGRAALPLLHARLLASAAAAGEAGATAAAAEGALLRLLADGSYETRLAGLLLARHLCGLAPTAVDDGVPPVAQPLRPSLPPDGAAERLSAAAQLRVLSALLPLAEAEPQRSCALHALALLRDAAADPAALPDGGAARCGARAPPPRGEPRRRGARPRDRPRGALRQRRRRRRRRVAFGARHGGRRRPAV